MRIECALSKWPHFQVLRPLFQVADVVLVNWPPIDRNVSKVVDADGFVLIDDIRNRSERGLKYRMGIGASRTWKLRNREFNLVNEILMNYFKIL